jgi:hypothetical protein
MRAKALERCAPRGEGVLARGAGGNFAGLYAEWQKRRIRLREGDERGCLALAATAPPACSSQWIGPVWFISWLA